MVKKQNKIIENINSLLNNFKEKRIIEYPERPRSNELYHNLFFNVLTEMEDRNSDLSKTLFNPLMLKKLNYSVLFTKFYVNEIGFFYKINKDFRTPLSEFFYGSEANIFLNQNRTNEIISDNKGFFHTHPSNRRLLFSPMDIATIISNDCEEAIVSDPKGNLMFIDLIDLREKYIAFIETDGIDLQKRITEFERIRNNYSEEKYNLIEELGLYDEYHIRFKIINRKWNRANVKYEFYLEQYKLDFFRFLIKNGNLRIIKLWFYNN